MAVVEDPRLVDLQRPPSSPVADGDPSSMAIARSADEHEVADLADAHPGTARPAALASEEWASHCPAAGLRDKVSSRGAALDAEQTGVPGSVDVADDKVVDAVGNAERHRTTTGRRPIHPGVEHLPAC
jgi:hypothetical protein